jgi:hypothetical protein
MMGDQAKGPAQETVGLPPVFLNVPDKSGMFGAGTTTVLNTGLTEAEARTAAEPAPELYTTKAQRRRSNILGAAWILACMTIGGLYNAFGRALEGPIPGEAKWLLWALLVLIPTTFVLTFYPDLQKRRHKKRHKEWVARFIGNWPLREGLVEVERIPDLRQRIIVEDLAATMAGDREAVLRQPDGGSLENARLLMEALTAVGAYASAAADDPVLEMTARQAVARFSGQAGRRRELPEPSGPPAVPVQRLRRRSNGSVNDGGR